MRGATTIRRRPGAPAGPYHHSTYELYALDTKIDVAMPQPTGAVAARTAELGPVGVGRGCELGISLFAFVISHVPAVMLGHAKTQSALKSSGLAAGNRISFFPPKCLGTFPQYFDAVDALPKGINYGGYIGHSALRTWVMGERAFSEQATPDELKGRYSRIVLAVKAQATEGAVRALLPPSLGPLSWPRGRQPQLRGRPPWRWARF